MFIPTSFGVAFPLLLLSLCCWGSWSNSVKASKLPFPLFYYDFALATFASGALFAVTLGNKGTPSIDDRGFALSGRSWDDVGYAVAAGVVFNIANMLLVTAIEMAGLAVAFPVSIGTALVLGTVVTYAVQPVGDVVLLFVGVALGFAAVVAMGLAHRELAQRRKPQQLKGPADPEGASDALVPKTDGSKSHSVVKGLTIAGLFMGSWSPLTAKSMAGTSDGRLTPYGSFFWYTLAILASTIAGNWVFMKWPLVGDTCGLGEYFSAPLRAHAPGLIGGFVWAVGTLSNLVAGRQGGFAVAYAIGQSSPMVAALWGIWFGELRGATTKSWILFGTMFVCYIAAIAVICVSHLVKA